VRRLSSLDVGEARTDEGVVAALSTRTTRTTRAESARLRPIPTQSGHAARRTASLSASGTATARAAGATTVGRRGTTTTTGTSAAAGAAAGGDRGPATRTRTTTARRSAAGAGAVSAVVRGTTTATSAITTAGTTGVRAGSPLTKRAFLSPASSHCPLVLTSFASSAGLAAAARRATMRPLRAAAVVRVLSASRCSSSKYFPFH
jgi:hypothetical protein